MKKISSDVEICKFNGVGECTVYLGGLSNLDKAELVWRVDEEYKEMYETEGYVLTLKEIQEQLKDKRRLITIIVNEPLHSEIWQYGNYNDDTWYCIAEGCGYA